MATYDEAGRYAGRLTYHRLCKLPHLHLCTGMASQDIAQQIVALLKVCLTVTRKRDARRHILMHHKNYEPALLDGLACALNLSMHWFASSLTFSVSIPSVAGAGAEQGINGLGEDAYKANWTGCGLVNPPPSGHSYRALQSGH